MNTEEADTDHETSSRTPDQQAAAERRDQLLEVAKVTEEAPARRMLQEQAEREAIRAGERRIYTEPWVAPMRVRVSPLTSEMNDVLRGVPHLEIVDVLPDVTLERGDDEIWYLTDAVHEATRERALFAMTDGQVIGYARRLLERYYRLVIPLRLAETSQLQGGLAVAAFGDEGKPYEPNASGVIEVTDGAPLMVHVTNQYTRPLRVYTLNVASSGRCQFLGDQLLQPQEQHTFAAKRTPEGELKPWKLHPGQGRTFAIDRFVVLGTTSFDRDLSTLLQNKPFVDIFNNARGPGQEQDDPPDLEEWVASNLVFQITLPLPPPPLPSAT